MSKPDSGHFKGTTGNIIASIKSAQDFKSAIIPIKGFDDREHPTKYKQLNSKRMKSLREKLRNRTITKPEYKHLTWQIRLNARRKAGIDSFWEREMLLLKCNLPATRNWSADQRLDILNGKRPKYKGLPLQSHHTYSVAKYPHLANIGSLIYPVTRYEHFYRWHGENYKNSFPGAPINYQIPEEF